MNSTQSNTQFLFDLYANWSRRMQENPNMTIEDFRSMFDEWHQPTLEPEEVSYKFDVGVMGSSPMRITKRLFLAAFFMPKNL